MKSPSPSLEAFEDEDDDGDSDNDDDDDDEDASLPSDDEMSTLFTYPLSLVTKRGSSFNMRVVIYIGGELVYEIFLLGGVSIFFEGCNEDLCIFFLLFF